MQGFAADPVYAKGEVFAYIGLPQNLKDLKDPKRSSNNLKDLKDRWEFKESKGPKERKQGFSAEQVPVSASGGSLKDLKDLKRTSSGVRLCWELEEPKAPRFIKESFLRKGVSLGYVGRMKT